MTARGRLRWRRDFAAVRAEGVKVRRPSVTLYVRHRSPDHGPARLGLAVATRCGSAVTRNRIKRRLRAAFERSTGQGAMDVVAHARAATAEVPFQELVDAFDAALEATPQGASR